jgi:hypothetical protein
VQRAVEEVVPASTTMIGFVHGLFHSITLPWAEELLSVALQQQVLQQEWQLAFVSAEQADWQASKVPHRALQAAAACPS